VFDVSATTMHEVQMIVCSLDFPSMGRSLLLLRPFTGDKKSESTQGHGGAGGDRRRLKSRDERGFKLSKSVDTTRGLVKRTVESACAPRCNGMRLRHISESVQRCETSAGCSSHCFFAGERQSVRSMRHIDSGTALGVAQAVNRERIPFHHGTVTGLSSSPKANTT